MKQLMRCEESFDLYLGLVCSLDSDFGRKRTGQVHGLKRNRTLAVLRFITEESLVVEGFEDTGCSISLYYLFLMALFKAHLVICSAFFYAAFSDRFFVSIISSSSSV